MRRHLIALPLAALLVTGPTLNSAMAEDESPEALAAEGLSRLMDAIELFVGNIPLYGAPEILPNGDILIPRLNPADGSEGGSDEDDEQTDT